MLGVVGFGRRVEDAWWLMFLCLLIAFCCRLLGVGEDRWSGLFMKFSCVVDVWCIWR